MPDDSKEMADAHTYMWDNGWIMSRIPLASPPNPGVQEGVGWGNQKGGVWAVIVKRESFSAGRAPHHLEGSVECSGVSLEDPHD